jgi:sugar lactone lactonase YvrE
MQRLLVFLAFIGLLGLSLPVAAQADTISIEYPSLYPEGIEYNPFTEEFLVSSAFLGTVFTVDRQGNITQFIEDDRLIATLGLRVDAEQNRLLVLNSDGGTASGSSPDTAGQIAALGIYDLATGAVIDYINLANLFPDSPHFVNDLALDPKGNIYITDSFTPAIYRVDAEGNEAVFLFDEAFIAEGGVGLNGIIYHPGGYLIVAHYSTGILYRVPLDTPEAFEHIAVEVEMIGADGLVLVDEQQLAVVVNGSINQVLLLNSSDNWETAAVLGSQPTGEVFATTAVQVDETLYILHGYLDRLVNPDNLEVIDTFTIQPISLNDISGG